MAFPFGHGLSYTPFSYSWTSPPTTEGCGDGFVVCMEVAVKNTGGRQGTEVPQLYLSFPSTAGEPDGFQKTRLL